MRGFATPTTPSTVADWVEINLLLGHRDSLSESQLLDALQEDRSLKDLERYDAGDASPDDDDLTDEAEGLSDATLKRGVPGPAEILAEDAFGVLEDRANGIGDEYPLDVELSRVFVARDRPVYRFLCGLEARRLAGIRQGMHRGAQLFEVISAIAMTNYLGGRARSIGFPRRDASGFRQSVQALVREMRESLSVSVEKIPGTIKDLGVDVAAWRRLDDAPGTTVVLCQCATGSNWNAKGVDLEVWAKVVRHAVTPTRALLFPTVPDLDPNSLDWDLMCGRVGVPLHRLRMASLLPTDQLNRELLSQITAWTNETAAVVFGDPSPAGTTEDEDGDRAEDLPESLQAVLPSILIPTTSRRSTRN